MTLLSRRLSWVLALLAALAAPAQAQGDRSAPPPHLGAHILTAGPDGGLICDEATEAQVALLEQAPSGGGRAVNLTALPSLNPPGLSDFRIVLRATDQLLAQPEALLAFRRAAARWERIIRNPVTTIIDVDFGPERFNTGRYPPTVLGSTQSVVEFVGEGAVTADLVAALRAQHAANPQLTALYDAIPVPTPSTAPEGTGGRPLDVPIANLITLQALGLRPAVLDADTYTLGRAPTIGFNSSFTFDFDPADGIAAGQTDFEGVAVHEIGHALGFTSAIGFSNPANTAQPILFTPWDLFRVRPEAVTPGESLTDGDGWETALRVITPGPINTEVLVVENGVTYYKPVQVTFDGEAEYETSTATGGRQGGDGQQASHWRDDALRPPSLGADRYIGIMDPNIGTGQAQRIKRADIRLLELVGYTVDYESPTGVLALSVGGRDITEPLVVPEIALGDVSPGATFDVPIEVGNVDLVNSLDYEISVVLDAVFPDGVAPSVTLSRAEGAVAPGGQSVAILTIGGVDEPAFIAGRLQVRANDNDRGFVEVPFTFSVGGATEPSLIVTSDVGDGGSVGDVALDAQKTFTLNLASDGSLPLTYRASASFSFLDLGLSSKPRASRLAQRLGGAAETLFSANFEDPADLSQFTYEDEAAPDRWQVTAGGKASLAGHSAPNAAYFGSVDGSFEYSNNSVGQLTTTTLDLSGLSGDVRVTLGFSYYLSAEAGFDIASVVYSLDGGQTFREAATSSGGILRNTDDGWENVVVELAGLAGFSEVQVGFRFESDGGVVDEGFYVDDVEIVAAPGAVGFFVEPVAGVIPGNGSVDLTATVNGPALERGFYRGLVTIETNERRGAPEARAVTFSVGGPIAPSAVPVGGAPTFTALPGQTTEVSLTIRNPGDFPLSYVRVLEPATSDYATADQLTSARPAAAASPSEVPVLATMVSSATPSATAASGTRADGDILAQIDLPGIAFPGDITELPDGRILVLDIGLANAPGSYGRTYLLAPDLSTVTVVPSPFTGGATNQTTGITYNSNTGSLWFAQVSGTVRELRLDESGPGPQLVSTGVAFSLAFTPYGLAYSPEIDAFITTPLGSDLVYFVDVEGKVLPGYPSLIEERGTNIFPGVSFTEGLLEIGGSDLQIVQRGQFGRTFEAGVDVVETSERLQGAPRIAGYLRSAADPDGTAYYVVGDPIVVPNGAVGRVFLVDPPDVPEGVGTRVEAREPLYGDQTVEAGQQVELALRIDGLRIDGGSYTDEIAFLTNGPSAQVVRIPVTIQVSGVASEDGEFAEFTFRGAVPNPVRSAGSVQFDLPEAADVTLSVYNMLGQRVSVLADRQPMAAGAHEVPFQTAGLAAGVYVVRLSAGSHAGSQKVTVVR